MSRRDGCFHNVTPHCTESRSRVVARQRAVHGEGVRCQKASAPSDALRTLPFHDIKRAIPIGSPAAKKVDQREEVDTQAGCRNRARARLTAFQWVTFVVAWETGICFRRLSNFSSRSSNFSPAADTGSCALVIFPSATFAAAATSTTVQRETVIFFCASVIFQLSTQTAHRAPVTSHRAAVTSHRAAVTAHRAAVTAHPAAVTSHPAAVTSHSAAVTSHSAAVTSCCTSIIYPAASAAAPATSVSATAAAILGFPVQITDPAI
jgi:hypothetical protein